MDVKAVGGRTCRPAVPHLGDQGARILRGLSELCNRESLTHLSALRDTRMEAWATRSIDA
jgi:hypothetical protein